MQHCSGLSLHADAVANHELSQPVAVDKHDAGVDLVGLLAGAGTEAAAGDEDAAVALCAWWVRYV